MSEAWKAESRGLPRARRARRRGKAARARPARVELVLERATCPLAALGLRCPQIGGSTAETETDSPTSTSGGGASSESSTVRVRGATLEVTRPGDGTTVHGAVVPHSDVSSRQREPSGNESHTAQRSLAFVAITSAAVGQPGSLGWTAIGEEGTDEAETTPFMMSAGVSG